MGFLSKIFGGGKPEAAQTSGPPPECGHMTLVPRWDNAADMGDKDKVTVYSCESCQQQFTPAEAQNIRETAGL